MACHALSHSTVCHSKGDDGIATADVVIPCILANGHDAMPRPMLSDHVLLSKGDDGMPRLILSDYVLLSKGDDGIPRPT